MTKGSLTLYIHILECVSMKYEGMSVSQIRGLWPDLTSQAISGAIRALVAEGYATKDSSGKTAYYQPTLKAIEAFEMVARKYRESHWSDELTEGLYHE